MVRSSSKNEQVPHYFLFDYDNVPNNSQGILFGFVSHTSMYCTITKHCNIMHTCLLGFTFEISLWAVFVSWDFECPGVCNHNTGRYTVDCVLMQTWQLFYILVPWKRTFTYEKGYQKCNMLIFHKDVMLLNVSKKSDLSKELWLLSSHTSFRVSS